MFMATTILNTKAAARYLGISVSALSFHRYKGTGPSWFRLTDGKHAPCFYAVEDLDAWVRQRRG